MSRVVWFNRGDDESGVHLIRHHNCPSASIMRQVLRDETVDELDFAIGIAGRGMPGDTPFVVTASAGCGVCGSSPSLWAGWVKKLYLGSTA